MPDETMEETSAFLEHYGVRRNRVELADARRAGLAKVHKKGREIASGPTIERRKVYGGGDYGGEMGQSALSGKIPDKGLLYNVIEDEDGYITGFELVDEDLVQTTLSETEEFLAHFGVKGMKWGERRSAEERRADRTLRIQEKAVKKIKKQEEFTARAKAREAAAKAKTETQDARSAAATAKLESKLARDQTRFARKEARSGHDDPINQVIVDKTGNPRDINGLIGKTDRAATKQRLDAAKGVRTLDDDTLKAYTQRLDTEKKLKNAIAEDVNPRKAAAKKLIADSGKEVAKKALVGVGSMAVFYGFSRMSKTHSFKPDVEGIGNLLSGTKGSSAAGAFTKTEKMAKLAGGLEIPMSEVAKWKVPSSMGKGATPF